jgi:radical SAM enzyme (TIGR01210 family)
MTEEFRLEKGQKRGSNFLLKSAEKALKQVLINDFQPGPPHTPSLYFEDTNYIGTPCRMPMIILRTRGCSWHLARGGCTMCGYSGASSKWQETDETAVIEQLETTLTQIQGSRPIMIMVTSAGSFFDDTELPKHLRRRILERIVGLDFLVSVNTETRADTVPKNRESIAESIEFLQNAGKELCVGIGLESMDDFVRQICVHKGLSLKTYSKAVKILKDLGSYVTTYVLLKPPFLTERESIEDTLRTIKFAFESGSDVVVVMLSNVQACTLTYRLWTKGIYRTPWLWSAVEVVKRTPDDMRERTTIAGIQAVPKPIQIAYNCFKCDSSLVGSLINWNKYRDYDRFEKEIKESDCECRQKWEREVSKDCPLSLQRRVEEGYGSIED